MRAAANPEGAGGSRAPEGIASRVKPKEETLFHSLEVTNFTAFRHAELRFSRGLNVIAGENGLGKTHLLKLPYAAMAASAEEGRKRNAREPSGKVAGVRIAEKLVNVFRPDALGRLARRRRGGGHSRSEAMVRRVNEDESVGFTFSTASKSTVNITHEMEDWCKTAPVFLPTRELLTIYPGFASLYDTHKLEFDETWRDTCIMLGAPTRRGPRGREIANLLDPLEEQMGGQLILESGDRFYVNPSSVKGLEIPLVGEGLRKLGMLARLIMTDSLRKGSCLFWDEPEANLNPKLIREVARAILGICRSGVQVIAATHNLFFLREIEILLGGSEFKNVKQRYFALRQGEDGVEISQGRTVGDMEPLTLLDENLRQSDRYMEEFSE